MTQETESASRMMKAAGSSHLWREGSGRDAVTARLMASKREYQKQETEAGYAEGVEWAKELADYEQLLKLASNTEITRFWDSHRKQDRQFAQWLDGLMGKGGSDSLFSSVINDGDYPSDDYAIAFMWGALEVFNEVTASPKP